MKMRGETFAAGDLIKLPRPPMLAKVWPGNRVMLASGGPDMVVMDVNGNAVSCWWETSEGTQRHVFDIATLTCAGAR